MSVYVLKKFLRKTKPSFKAFIRTAKLRISDLHTFKKKYEYNTGRRREDWMEVKIIINM